VSLLQFKGRVGPTEILNGLRQARGRKGGMSGATFRFAAGSSPTPGAVALLAAWILSDRQAGGAPQISGDTAVIEALRRIDRSNLLGLPRSASAPAPRTNVVPLIAISDGAKVNEAVDSLCDIVMRHAVEPRAVMPAIEWAANEVTDNVELHASAATPGVFYARIDERRQRLELAVVDQGIGIRQSLASSTPTGSDGEAIAKALQRGVTRDPKIGQGNPLDGLGRRWAARFLGPQRTQRGGSDGRQRRPYRAGAFWMARAHAGRILQPGLRDARTPPAHRHCARRRLASSPDHIPRSAAAQADNEVNQPRSAGAGTRPSQQRLFSLQQRSRSS
jgi:hypothetical protein